MSNKRQQQRKHTAELAAIIRKAKADMQRWISSLSELPSQAEVKAFQAGYIAGINRGSNAKE